MFLQIWHFIFILISIHFYLISIYFISCAAIACDMSWSKDEFKGMGSSSYSIKRYISELSV